MNKRFFLLGGLLFLSSCALKPEKEIPPYFLDKFPTAQFEKIEMGNSDSDIYKIVASKQKTYLARALPSYMKKEDVHREVVVMKMMSKLKVAPDVHFVSADERSVIMNYIDGRPFYAPKVPLKLFEVLARKLKVLHNSKIPELKNKPSSFVGVLRLKSSALSYQKLRNIFLEMENRLLQSAPLVPCHMDFHPGNIIQTLGNVWIIDWTDARFYSPYYDLARIVVDIPFSNSQEKHFLKTYFKGQKYLFNEKLYHAALVVAKIRVIDFLLNSFVSVSGTKDNNANMIEEIFAAALEKGDSEVERIVALQPSYGEALKLLGDRDFLRDLTVQRIRDLYKTLKRAPVKNP